VKGYKKLLMEEKRVEFRRLGLARGGTKRIVQLSGNKKNGEIAHTN